MTNGANDTAPTNELLNGIIEPEDDSGSGYETSTTLESETTSLTSSLQEWMVENGKI